MKIAMRPTFSRLIISLVTLILLISVSACGRKGDPILITPDDKAGLDRSISDDNTERAE